MRLSAITGIAPPRIDVRNSVELSANNIFLGMEFEIENVRHLRLPDEFTAYWEHKEDHSLRDRGMEFVFRHPLRGQDVIDALDIFLRVARENEWTISERTGLHVHLDVRDLEEHQQLLMLLCYYAFLERPIFQFSGMERADNNFSLAWFNAENDLRYISYLQENENAQAINHMLARVQKYSALNLSSLLRYGTVEFRHMQTTLDRTKIVTWLNLILMLKISAMNNLFHNEPMEFVNHVSLDGPEPIARTLLGRDLWNALAYPEATQDLRRGMRVAQDLVLYYRIDNVPFNPPPDVDATPRETPFGRWMQQKKRGS